MGGTFCVMDTPTQLWCGGHPSGAGRAAWKQQGIGHF